MNDKLRMKDACTRTGLTERAVRLYIEKGLLHPWQEEQNDRVLTFFSEEDIARLEDIAVLRKAGFSIDSIVTMTKYPQTIGDIVREQLERTLQEAEESRAVSELLQNAAKENCRTVHELCTALNREPMHSIPVPHADSEPDFSKFEDATEQERLDGLVDHIITQRRQARAEDRRKKILRTTLVWFCILLVCVITAAVCFAPHHIERTMTCYQYKGTTGKAACDVQVTINGDFYTPPLLSPYFIGEITFEQLGDEIPTSAQFPESWGNPVRITEKITFSITCNYSATVSCTDPEGNNHLFGVLYMLDDYFADFEIWLYQPIAGQGRRYINEYGYIIGTDTITNAVTYESEIDRLFVGG